jgi:DNA-directed RNA polymerase subunit omega
LEDNDFMTAESQAPDSKFAFVVVAARRARQLMLGASPLVANPRSHKSTRVAIEELGAGVLEYQLPEIPGESVDKDGKRRKE